MKKIVALSEGVLYFFIGACMGGYLIGHKYCKKLNEYVTEVNNRKYQIRLYDIWVSTKPRSQGIERYLLDRNITNVAIYGASFLGTRLYYELKETNINVKVIFDTAQNTGLIGIDIKDPRYCRREEVDAVIVTDFFNYYGIERLMKVKGYKRIISFDNILYEIMKLKS